MDKIFNSLRKPADLVFIIGAFLYAVWFAIETIFSIDGQVLNILGNIVVLIVGALLIALPPIMLLMRKDNLAKLFFVFLLGYWVIFSARNYLFFAETFGDSREVFPIITGIFLFIVGLLIVGILAMVILDIILGLPALRPIIDLLALIFVGASFIAAILFMIYAGIQGAGWTYFVKYALMEMIVLPVTVGFGCLYFFRAKEGKNDEESF